MKKFIALLFVLFVPFVILNFLYTYSEFNFGDNKIDQFKTVPDGIQLANSGSSLGQVFNYSEQSEYVTFNFALPNQAINCDYKLLNEYIGKFAENSVYTIVLTFGEIDGIQPPDQYDVIKCRYYRILSKENLDDYSFWKSLKYKFFPISEDSNPFRVIKVQFCPDREMVDKVKEISTIKQNEPVSAELFALRNPKEKAFYTFERTFPRHGEEGLNYNFDYIIKMIKLCNQHKVTPVVFTPPYPSVTVGYLTEAGYLDNFERLKEMVASECSRENLKYEWIDYMSNPKYSEHHEYFGDVIHTQSYVRPMITEDYINELKSRNLLN